MGGFIKQIDSAEIGSGKVKINGTIYDVAMGKAKIDGTLYDITFSNAVKVAISGKIWGKNNIICGGVKIDGTTYTKGPVEIDLKAGDVITFSVKGYSSRYGGHVYVDGVSILTATTTSTKSVDWEIPKNVKSISVALSANSTYNYGQINVVTG